MKAACLLAGWMLFGCVSANAGERATDGLEIADYFKVKRIAELTLSGDGGALAYVVANDLSLSNGTAGMPARQVYLQPLTAQSTPVLLDALADASKLKWIPKTRQLAFLCKQDGSIQVCSYDTVSQQRAVLTSSADSVEQFDFATDGRMLAYLSRRPVETQKSLYERFRSDEPGIVIDTNQLEVYNFVDAQRGSMVRPPPSTLWIKDAAGRVSQVPVPGEVGGPNGAFHWSSDGALLSVTYVAATLPKSLMGQFSRTSLGVFRRASGDFRVIGEAVEPSATAPGLIFRGGEWVPGTKQLIVRRAKEVDPWTSTSFPDWTVAAFDKPLPEQPSAWHSMETYGSSMVVMPLAANEVLLDITYRGVNSLYQLKGDGVERSAIAAGVDGNSTLFTLSANRKVAAFVNSSLTRPGEIYVRDARGTLEQVTHLNDAVAAKIDFKAREVSWKSSDGVTASGWLLEPAAGKGPWPMVTHVHGGPGFALTNSFAPYFGLWPYPFEVMAARGIAVFLPNYRGTHTYGRAFASPKTLEGEPVADILSGVDSLVASGVADRDRLGISGHSHGGWLAPLAMAHGRYFRVGSFAEGSTNKVVNFALMSGDLNRQVHTPLAGASFYDDPQRYLEGTPELLYKGLSTATLFEAGATSLAIGMMSDAKATRHFGLPTEFIIYPRTGHNIALPVVQRESAERNLDWFDFWLRGRVDPAPAKREQYERWAKGDTKGR